MDGFSKQLLLDSEMCIEDINETDIELNDTIRNQESLLHQNQTQVLQNNIQLKDINLEIYNGEFI